MSTIGFIGKLLNIHQELPYIDLMCEPIQIAPYIYIYILIYFHMPVGRYQQCVRTIIACYKVKQTNRAGYFSNRDSCFPVL